MSGMTTDRQLVDAVVKLANCEKLVKADERELVKQLVDEYTRACEISRKSDKNRAAHWSLEAFQRGRKLQRWYQTVTGHPWRDMPLITGKKHRYT